MTREERKERIEWLKERLFMLNMIDRWTKRDYELDREWTRELRELEREV